MPVQRIERAADLPPRAKLLRGKGQGTVCREGARYRARLPGAARESLGLFESRQQAADALALALHLPYEPTVASWLDKFLRDRVVMRLRNTADDRNRLATHVLSDELAGVRLVDVTVKGARAWLHRVMQKRAGRPAHVRRAVDRPIASRTVKNVLTLMRSAFQVAVDEGRLESNPFRELRVRRASMATHVAEFEGVLDPDEQTIVLASFGAIDAGGVMLRVALGAGLRKSELRSLRWEDVHVTALEPALVVRFGTRGGPTKSGKPRRIPLFGVALEAMLGWRLARAHEHAGYVFRSKTGLRKKLPSERFRAALERAHIARRVCWHDLRHTCATSLLMGWWGRKWSVPEVQRMLGHKSPRTTERYLHARNELIFQAASEARQRDAEKTWQARPSARLMGDESDSKG